MSRLRLLLALVVLAACYVDNVWVHRLQILDQHGYTGELRGTETPEGNTFSCVDEGDRVYGGFSGVGTHEIEFETESERETEGVVLLLWQGEELGDAGCSTPAAVIELPLPSDEDPLEIVLPPPDELDFQLLTGPWCD